MEDTRFALAQRLLNIQSRTRRAKLLADLGGDEQSILARQLKDICVEGWHDGPSGPRTASKLVSELAGSSSDPQILAYAIWVEGIKDLTFGRLESAVERLTESSTIFAANGDVYESAKPQIALVTALAMLGENERVAAVGRRALRIFVQNNDDTSAGKVEINLSNFASRRGQHRRAEKLALSARTRFIRARSPALRSAAENGLAITYTELYDFRSAMRFFRSALDSARVANNHVTEAEIEASIGTLELNRGNFADSLKSFEDSRRKFEELGMEHKSAVAELEIAEIYSALNLSDEAAELYSRTAVRLAKLRMPVEEARLRLGFGNLLLRTGRYQAAQHQFARADRLFSRLHDANGREAIRLSNAWIELKLKNYDSALLLAKSSQRRFLRTGHLRHIAMAEWIIGSSLLERGEAARGLTTFKTCLANARSSGFSQVEFLCQSSIGSAQLKLGKTNRAITAYRNAIKISDRIREPLAADELRIAAADDRQEPYDRLGMIYASQGKFEEAFVEIENGRSKSLSDILAKRTVGSSASSKVAKKTLRLREELNWQYSRLRSATGNEARALRSKIIRQERELANDIRRSYSTQIRKSDRRSNASGSFDLSLLQSTLGPDQGLLYFSSFGKTTSVFTITGSSVDLFENITGEEQLYDLLQEFRFQRDAIRYGPVVVESWGSQLKARTDKLLGKMYRPFAEPIERMGNVQEIVIVPTGQLHYVPFCALRNENGYLAETASITYAPSAASWMMLRDRPRPQLKKPLLIGYADEMVPEVENEVRLLGRLLNNSKCLTGNAASFKNFIQLAESCDTIHIACHGEFRTDNPLYSSLYLSDGRINVRDVADRKLKAALVTLSACETGVNRLYSGNEIVGLARGFLAAGASSLVLSQWTVNDKATKGFMKLFYTELQRGGATAASIRNAQRDFIKKGEHPYFWAPFFHIG